jgi:hypothetical protein
MLPFSNRSKADAIAACDLRVTLLIPTDLAHDSDLMSLTIPI